MSESIFKLMQLDKETLHKRANKVREKQNKECRKKIDKSLEQSINDYYDIVKQNNKTMSMINTTIQNNKLGKISLLAFISALGIASLFMFDIINIWIYFVLVAPLCIIIFLAREEKNEKQS